MIVYNSEVVTLLVSDMKFANRTGIESNACWESCLNLNEHRVLKRIKTIINKFRNCSFFAKEVEGPWPPGPPRRRRPYVLEFFFGNLTVALLMPCLDVSEFLQTYLMSHPKHVHFVFKTEVRLMENLTLAEQEQGRGKHPKILNPPLRRRWSFRFFHGGAEATNERKGSQKASGEGTDLHFKKLRTDYKEEQTW